MLLLFLITSVCFPETIQALALHLMAELWVVGGGAEEEEEEEESYWNHRNAAPVGSITFLEKKKTGSGGGGGGEVSVNVEEDQDQQQKRAHTLTKGSKVRTPARRKTFKKEISPTTGAATLSFPAINTPIPSIFSEFLWIPNRPKSRIPSRPLRTANRPHLLFIRRCRSDHHP